MTRTERVQDYRSFWVMLIAIGMLAGVVITSCGGGSDGGSDGLLCDQCGDDPDGPCVPTLTIFPDPENDNIPQCTRPVNEDGSCTVELQCRRKSDSSQRRCFPVAPGGGDVDYQFRCDGSRPGGTPRPQPTATETPEAEPTSTPAPSTCNNQVREGNEVCDGTDLNNQTCETRGCSLPGGSLSCKVDCSGFNVNNCLGAGCREN
jgi:hypothetical protein